MDSGSRPFTSSSSGDATSSGNRSNNNKPRSKNNEELVERMRSRFAASEQQQQQHAALASTWDSMWKDGLTPWDLGQPTPALRSELESLRWNRSTTSERSRNKQTFRTLVPGCGAGYDLITLARHHEKWLTSSSSSRGGGGGNLSLASSEETTNKREAVIVGLDVSDASLQRASSVLKAALGDKFPGTRTRVDLVQADFFANNDDDSSTKTLFSFDGTSNQESGSAVAKKKTRWDGEPFDFIFDYLFFAALPLTLRCKWGERTAQLLQPGTGRLLTFMFPIIVDGNETPASSSSSSSTKGPPFAATVDSYREVLEPHGVFMEEIPRESPDTIKPRRGKELVCWWKKEQPRSML